MLSGAIIFIIIIIIMFNSIGAYEDVYFLHVCIAKCVELVSEI